MAGHLDDLEEALVISHRRDCYFADVPSPSLLKHQLKGEGGAAELLACSRNRPAPCALIGFQDAHSDLRVISGAS